MIEGAIVAAILCWGVAGIFAGRASKKGDPLSITAWTPLIALPILIIPLIMGVNFSPPAELLRFAFFSAMVLFCAWLAYFFALRKEDTSPIVAIGSAYPIFFFLDLCSFWICEP
jgi:drug/metabolite transporter (DMT)-like permease